MAIVNLTGFEAGGAPGDTGNNTTGTASYVTTPIRSGAYSARVAPTTTAVGHHSLDGVGFPLSTAYITFHFRYVTKATVDAEEILALHDGLSTTKGALRLNSAGKITVHNNTHVLQGTSTTVLAANTWYRIDFKIGNGSASSYELRINGVTEVSGTMNAAAVDTGVVHFGKWINRNGNSVEYYYDDVTIDNAGFTEGTLAVVSSVPTANGSTMQWTSGTAPSDYTTIDERPWSSTDYVASNGTANQTALFSFNTASTMGIVSTQNILAVKASTGVTEPTTGTSSVQVMIRSGASTVLGTSFDPTTAVRYTSLVATTDPATSTSWTSSGVTSVQAGVIQNNAVQARLTALLLSVAVVTPPPNNGKMIMMFM